MFGYIVKRLAIGVLLLAALSIAVFSLQQLAPGDVVNKLTRGVPKSPELVERIRHEYGLDRSLPVQYWFWLRDAVTGDFGRSFENGQPVGKAILTALPVSLLLATLGFALAVVLGVGLGIWCARRERSALDRTLNASAVVLGGAPPFILATVLIYVFTVQLSWFPTFGLGTGFADRLWHLALPAITLGVTGYALILKLTRAGVGDSMKQDYYGFAQARGVRGRKLIGPYALRPGLIPLVTGASTVFTAMLTAAIIVEVAFAVPGIASLFISAVGFSDVPMIQGVTLFVGAIVIAVNLIVDISYRIIDPRVRLGEREE